MEVSSKHTGVTSKPYHHEVTWRDTMNYAAAVGDGNPRYFDDERPEGIVAPPMFAVAVTWAFGRDADIYWNPDELPLDALKRQVHYTEHLELHRVVRPGDRLTVVADVMAVKPHRAGAYAIIRGRVTGADGEPIFTEYAGTLLRDVPCTDKGAGFESVPAAPKAPAGGDPEWDAALPVSPFAPYLYDGAANMFNPIHTSPAFAKSVGLPGHIVHGTCTLAWAVREITDREADSDPARVKAIGCRFTGMVFPGSEITVRLRGRDEQPDSTTVFFTVLNAEGKRVISNGYVVIANA
jgi:acyl dehydratase